MSKEKKELIDEVKKLKTKVTTNEARINKLEQQVLGLASVFKGMLEVAQEDNSVIDKATIEVISN